MKYREIQKATLVYSPVPKYERNELCISENLYCQIKELKIKHKHCFMTGWKVH